MATDLATDLAADPTPLLSVQQLDAWYDRSHVVQGLSLQVFPGEIVTLMGRNGAGKTTTLRALMGLVAKRRGQVRFAGHDCSAEPAHTRYHLGLAYVPEDRRIVPGLTVRENLQLGVIAQKGRYDLARGVDEIAETFPRLAERPFCAITPSCRFSRTVRPGTMRRSSGT